MNALAALSVHDLLNRVAAPTPTPGGGAAAAISGALGTALAEMVAALPRTRHDAEDERAALDLVRPAIAAARTRLQQLADLDVEAYDRLLRSRRLPKSSPEEAATRAAIIMDATKDATLVPLEATRLCADVLKLMETVAGAGHRAASSDLFVAIGLVKAAGEGSAASVRANLAGLGDAAFEQSSGRRLNAAIEDLLHSAHAAIGALQG